MERDDMERDDMERDNKELHLLDLPAEILHHIFTFLDVKNVRQVRLACRKLGAVGACHALPEVIFYLHKGDFDAVRMIANHPVYPIYVRSLVYVTDTLAPKLVPYPAYVAVRRSSDRVWQKEVARNPGWIARSTAPSPIKTIDEIKASYKEYKRMYQQQCEILDQDKDFEVIREMVAKFPNLQEVLVVSSEGESREGLAFPGGRTPFQKLYCHAHSFLKPEGTRQLKCMLEAIEAAGRKLLSLRAGCEFYGTPGGEPSNGDMLTVFLLAIHWEFFRESRFESARWIQVCANLTRFEIVIETEAAEGYLERLAEDEDFSEFDSPIVKCRRVMRRGLLKKVLANMPNLETLNIRFTYHDEESDGLSFPASLSDIIPPGMHWPNLESLKLAVIETDRQELVEFMVKHKDSLINLYLKDIRLVQSSWLKFLPQLKLELETPLMGDVSISGFIYGHNEEEGVEIEDEEEQWDLGDLDFEAPEPGFLVEDVTDYLLHDSQNICPLNRSNMDEDDYY